MDAGASCTNIAQALRNDIKVKSFLWIHPELLVL